ncbi:hypothetical protein GCM10008179_23650 [Hansschlegelia plantiphila]|uniref:Protamine-2 (Modular protein) n=1 Tax=Hansschlegelia plantiphila TaxID=374655 RepID=A0A9W6MWE0_9HYPH|nr:hypothetical protein GCM10008179_23650 [Hansschlegelia plantiphila]
MDRRSFIFGVFGLAGATLAARLGVSAAQAMPTQRPKTDGGRALDAGGPSAPDGTPAETVRDHRGGGRRSPRAQGRGRRGGGWRRGGERHDYRRHRRCRPYVTGMGTFGSRCW